MYTNTHTRKHTHARILHSIIRRWYAAIFSLSVPMANTIFGGVKCWTRANERANVNAACIQEYQCNQRFIALLRSLFIFAAVVFLTLWNFVFQPFAFLRLPFIYILMCALYASSNLWSNRENEKKKHTRYGFTFGCIQWECERNVGCATFHHMNVFVHESHMQPNCSQLNVNTIKCDCRFFLSFIVFGSSQIECLFVCLFAHFEIAKCVCWYLCLSLSLFLSRAENKLRN